MKMRRLFHAGLLALVFLTALSFGATPIRSSNDVWWHLKTGQYIAEHGYRLPRVDPFNFLAEDRGIEWHNHEWLGQLVFWWFYGAGEILGPPLGWGGLHGLILGKALLLAATYVMLALLGRRVSGAMLPGVIAALLAAEIGRRTFYPRPPVYTYLLLVGLYWLLHEIRAGRLRKRWLAIVLPYFGFWANLHGGWAAGGVVLAAFAAGSFFDSLGYHYRRTPLIRLPRAVVADVAPWLGAGLLAILGTLANPSGAHLYAIFDRVLSDRQLVGAIGELAPPDPRISTFFLLGLLLFVVLGLAVRRPFPRAAEYFFLPFFLWQALHHVRHLTLWGILMAPALAWLLAEALRQLPKGLAGLARVVCVALLLSVAVHWIFFRSENGSYWERNRSLLAGEGFVAANFPAAEAEFLRRGALAGLRGRLFNLDYYAGYLIWRLSPEPFQVFSDSRFDIFGGEFQRIANRLLTAPPGWNEELVKYGVNLALLPLNKLLTQEMIDHSDWELIFYRLQPRVVGGEIRYDPYDGWAILARRSGQPVQTLQRLSHEFDRWRRSQGQPEYETFSR